MKGNYRRRKVANEVGGGEVGAVGEEEEEEEERVDPERDRATPA